MPFYDYECSKHGVFEVFQRMTEKHEANCSKCGENGTRIFTPSALHGLPSQDKRMGKTREELFQNLGKEGFTGKDVWKYDKHYNKKIESYHKEN